MINSDLLKKKIRKAGFTQKEISQRIGISETGLSLKINNHIYFNTLEVEALCHWLKLCRNQDKIDIFFYQSSQNKDDSL